MGRRGVNDTLYSIPPDAKARWVWGGHRDTEKATVRTDSPTAPLLGLQFALVICSTNRWPIKKSDVSDAFLTGQALERQVYGRPPQPLPPKP